MRRPRSSPSVGQAVPLDSVQEFSVITSNFSAQYGRASGGVVNVATKSGTNSFRGTVYEFYRDDSLATNTFDNKANEIEKGKFDRHQMGFGLGGPIVKDKVHFFTSLEYIRVRSTDTQISWLPGLQLGEGQARHPDRRQLHAHQGRPDVRCLLERGGVPQPHVLGPALTRQLRARKARPFPERDQPERLPGRHVHDAGPTARKATTSSASTRARTAR